MTKTSVSIGVLLGLLCFGLAAQTTVPLPVAKADVAVTPQFAIEIGAGFSQYTDPKRTLSGGLKVRVADGTYECSYLDQGMKLNAGTGKLEPISTVRTGVTKRLAQQGPLGFWAGGDIGLVAGAGNVTGAGGLNGQITYELPQRWKVPGLYAHAGGRLLKSPQPAVSDPAVVQTAFTFGIGWHSQ